MRATRKAFMPCKHAAARGKAQNKGAVNDRFYFFFKKIICFVISTIFIMEGYILARSVTTKVARVELTKAKLAQQ